jgi:hypothetical protein
MITTMGQGSSSSLTKGEPIVNDLAMSTTMLIAVDF